MRQRWIALFLGLVLLAGCGRGETEPTTEVQKEPARLEVTAVDFGFSFDAPAVAAGEVTTVLTNEGEVPHQLGYYKLNKGVAYDEFVAAILEDESQIPQLAEGGRAGVMRPVSPGDAYTRPSDQLEPGVYALLCSIRDPETGQNHYELGMVSELVVK